MTEKELRSLGRAELLEILAELSSENERLQAQLKELKEHFSNSDIRMANTGSITAAVPKIRDIFAAAEQAAAPHLETIRNYAVFSSSRQKEAEVTAAKIIADAQWTAQKRLNDAEKEAQLTVMRAKQEAEQHWFSVSRKLDRFWSEYKGLQKYLDVNSGEKT